MTPQTPEPPTEITTTTGRDLTKTPQSVKSNFPKYWDRDYIHRGLDSIEDPKHKMLFYLLWVSGLRITEALELRKKDIDLTNYTLEALWQKSRKYKYRIVPIHPQLRNMLEIYCATLKTDERLFPISRVRAWQLARRHLGGNPHMFRHSFAVNWLRCGGDLVILHRILGHSRIQTTMEYLKIVPIDQGKELLKITF